MMSTIDIGEGKSVPRHHIPKSLRAAFDGASDQLEQARASIRSWVRPQYAMQAPAAFSGTVSCGGPAQTGRDYALAEPGGAILVDERDVSTFAKLAFTAVPKGAAPANPRVGLVFMDTQLNEHLRWDGSNWTPVALT